MEPSAERLLLLLLLLLLFVFREKLELWRCGSCLQLELCERDGSQSSPFSPKRYQPFCQTCDVWKELLLALFATP